MLFIRTNDSAKIQGESGEICFLEQNRKGNIVKKFSIANTELKYSFEVLETKMIPKKSISILDYHPIKLIMTSNQNILVFQDMDCKVKFLTLNEGNIVTKTFEELSSNEDSILCYDGEDWYLDDIELLSVCYLSEIEEYNSEEFKDIELSNYILYSENDGIIINNIFII